MLNNILNKNQGLLIVVNYNQERELEPFLLELQKYWNLENIVLVDDGSTDRSVQLARKYKVPLLEHTLNRGVGAAIRTGINFAISQGYKFVTIMSSNGKMYPSQLDRVIEPILTGRADYSTGSRFISGGDSPGLSVFRKWSIPVFSRFMSFFLGKQFSDITCGFRSYRVELFETNILDINQPWLDKYQMEFYIHYYFVNAKKRIVEVPVVIPYVHLEKGRKTKIKPIIDWWKMITPIIYLRLGFRK